MGADSVGADDPTDLSRVGVGDAAAPAGDASVVDKNVDGAELSQYRLYHHLILVEGVD